MLSIKFGSISLVHDPLNKSIDSAGLNVISFEPDKRIQLQGKTLESGEDPNLGIDFEVIVMMDMVLER